MSHAKLAEVFVKDEERTNWHDKALWYVRTKRDIAANTVPEWEQLRDLASQIKSHTISQLDRYLVQFEENATKLGAVVHWADSAEEHNKIVHQILQSKGIKKVVKSKSMLTEECGLNPYLYEMGYEVIDTDLGERIVQLKKETPSHIVLPAIHLKKEDVSEVFETHLGTEVGNSDPKYLTESARTHLREYFLSAEAGITGINFAIAETGGFVICTNEGNADLGTSLPKVHIASMGIEKIIPKLEHLGVFLRLLARSATGQPITSYTSHFHGPAEGSELHIVMVNNGRTDIREQDDFRPSLNCIRCGACMNTCPVFRRSGGHSYNATIPGPIGSILSPEKDPNKHNSLPYACTLCGSCTDICPVKIDLHHQLFLLRGKLVKSGHVPLFKIIRMKIAKLALMNPKYFSLAGKISRFLLPKIPRAILYNKFNPWGIKRELPIPPRQSFREINDKEKLCD